MYGKYLSYNNVVHYWQDFYENALGLQDNHFNIVIVKYEDLLLNTAECVEGFRKLVGIVSEPYVLVPLRPSNIKADDQGYLSARAKLLNEKGYEFFAREASVRTRFDKELLKRLGYD